MAELPEILEDTPDELEITENGIATARNFDVMAESSLDAAVKLKQQKGVYRGAVWRSYHGEMYDLATICQRVRVKPEKGAPVGGQGRYLIKAPYSRDTSEAEPGGEPKYRIKGKMQSQPVDIDANGNPITNTVSEPIDPPLTMLQPSETVRVEWYRSGDQFEVQAFIRQFRGALNSNLWLGAMAGSFLCNGIELADRLEDGWNKLVGEFSHAPPIDPSELRSNVYQRNQDGSVSQITGQVHGWHKLYANRGKRIDTGDNKSDGTPKTRELDVNEPVPLTKDGKRLPRDATPVAILVPMYQTFMDFGQLGI